MNAKLIGVLVPALALGAIGCEKKEEGKRPEAKVAKKDEAKKDEAKKDMAKTETKPTEAPKPKTGTELAAWYTECWGHFFAKDEAKFSACYTADSLSDSPDTGMPQFKGAANIVAGGAKMWWTAFPDLNGEVDLVLVNGNHVAGVGRIAGTHTGPMKTPQGDLPPSNKKIGYQILHLADVSPEGKVQQEWIFGDMGTLMGQLGVSPAPHRPVMAAAPAEKPVVVATDSKTEQDNVALVKAAHAAMNKHDVAGMSAFMADDVVIHDMPMPTDITGKAAFEKNNKEGFAGFPDMALAETTTWGAGDYVVSVGVWSGTNTGDMPSMGLKKTGKKVTVTGAEISKISGGKIKEQWIFYNGMAMAQQLGLIPAPGAPAPGGDNKAPEKPAK